MWSICIWNNIEGIETITRSLQIYSSTENSFFRSVRYYGMRFVNLYAFIRNGLHE
jgi:hypothetical protein